MKIGSNYSWWEDKQCLIDLLIFCPNLKKSFPWFTSTLEVERLNATSSPSLSPSLPPCLPPSLPPFLLFSESMDHTQLSGGIYDLQKDPVVLGTYESSAFILSFRDSEEFHSIHSFGYHRIPHIGTCACMLTTSRPPYVISVSRPSLFFIAYDSFTYNCQCTLKNIIWGRNKVTLLYIPLSGEKSSLCPTLLACLLIKSSKKGQKTWEEWWEDLLLKWGGEGEMNLILIVCFCIRKQIFFFYNKHNVGECFVIACYEWLKNEQGWMAWYMEREAPPCVYIALPAILYAHVACKQQYINWGAPLFMSAMSPTVIII